MAKSTIYTIGGTVQAGGGIYIKRKADDELLELCRQSEFAFILSSRQVGKSSLMVRTAQQLEKENIRSVTIDLSAIGVNVSSDEWYLGILNEVATTLNLETDIFAWWKQYAQLGPAQHLTNFFKEVLLREVKEQIVLFFDEIDSTLSIPFSDDFYIALRAVYNARSTTPDFKRLSFVLVGVAAPSDLISDNKRTPFNIGHRVEINDFTLAEALPLAEGLGQQAVQALTWVFQYTSGHPYLTQRLCAHLANSKESINEGAITEGVERLFTGEQGKQDNNLQFVRDMLSKRSPDVTKVLLIYREIRSGKKVVDDERSIAKAHLKLSGLVRSEKGILRVRNEIYNTAFNPHWVQENIPKNWQKVALISLSTALGILLLGTLAIFINDYFVGSRIDKRFRSFISAATPERRLSDLAEIYRQKGILSNKDSDLTASELFYGLSTAEDQLAIFRVYDIQRNPALQNDLVLVISHLYTTVANVDPEEDNTELLQNMLNALSNIQDDPIANRINNEITSWIAARKSQASGDNEAALDRYGEALSFNPGNHALLYERAKVYVDLGQYVNALNDLESTIGAAKQSVPNIATHTPTVSPIPGSTTSNTTEAQTDETGVPPDGATVVPTEINRTPTQVITPTLELTLTPAPVPTALPTYTPPPKYESNFTTLIEIINAVQAVIENTPELQIAMQTNGDGTYTNLQSFGLIPTVSTEQVQRCGDTSKLASEIFLYNWVEYIDPAVKDQFEAECGVIVTETNYDSNEMLLATLQAGGGSYDIIVPSDYMTEIMISEGMLMELDFDVIANIANIASLNTNQYFDPNQKYTVPYFWGTSGFAVDTSVVTEYTNSWSMMFDLNSPYCGKISMLDDERETIGAALMYLGYSINDTDSAHLEEAKNLLIEQSKCVKAYDSQTNDDLIISGETVLAHMWTGDGILAGRPDYGGREGIVYIIPSEGCTIWQDNMAVPVDAPNAYTAMVFMNYVLFPDVAARNTTYVGYATPNVAAKELLDPEIRSNEAIYPSADVEANLQWIEDVGDALQLYDRIWTEFKAAAGG